MVLLGCCSKESRKNGILAHGKYVPVIILSLQNLWAAVKSEWFYHPSMHPLKTNRAPQLIIWFGVALTSFLSPHLFAQHGGHGGGGETTTNSNAILVPGRSLLTNQPVAVRSTNGVLNVDLIAKYGEVYLQDRTNHLRLFNGRIPAPTLFAKPGDNLRIRLINRLPHDEHDMDEDHHSLNSINLHTHGLNVSPENNEDNVLLEIFPQEYLQYEIKIPTNHPAGTFWYHPHKHGAATIQVGSGMTGNIIITDGEGDIQLPGVQDVQLHINEIPLLPTGEVISDPFFGFFDPAVRKQWTVNGLPIDQMLPNGNIEVPSIPIRPGEVQKWRITHAGINEFLLLQLDGHSMQIASYDGITIPVPQTTNSILIGPGNRVDLLIQAGMTPGNFSFKKLANGVQGSATKEDVLAIMVVQGTQAGMTLPTTLTAPTNRLPDIMEHEIVRRRNISFEISGLDPGFDFKFTINNKLFDFNRVDETMMLNTAEEWTFVNDLNDTHPAHIHVNWFQVVKINGRPITPQWRDTIILPQKTNPLDPLDGTVTVRHRFQGYAGKYVLHCHILPHEDIGMMALMEVIDPANLTALQSWRNFHFNSPINEFDGADSADPDGDGIINFLDFAFGHRPNTAAGLPSFKLTNNFLAVTFGRRKPLNSDVSYEVRKSRDLVNWTNIDINSNMVGTPVDYDIGAELVTVRADTPLTGPGAGDREFLQVRAIKPVLRGRPITPDIP